MSNPKDTGETGLGQLPGTGGDIADLDHDVEGHRAKTGGPSDFNPDAPKPGEGVRMNVDGTGERVDGKDDDTEGHLFHLGPTTEGEFSRRGPGENPHGDR